MVADGAFETKGEVVVRTNPVSLSSGDGQVCQRVSCRCRSQWQCRGVPCRVAVCENSMLGAALRQLPLSRPENLGRLTAKLAIVERKLISGRLQGGISR